MVKNNAFESEWEKTLQILADKNATLKEFEYFLNIAREYYSQFGKNIDKPRLIVIGSYFPDEIIEAMQIDFSFVFGGSCESSIRSTVNIPKDADDETRSLISILTSDKLNLKKDDMVLVPLFNDGMKKLKAVLKDITTVVCYEVPSDKEDLLQKERYANEIKNVTEKLKRHFKKKLSVAKLKKQCLISKKAAETFCKLEELFKEKTNVLSASAFLFIASTYNMCKDKNEWTLHIESFIAELRNNLIATNSYAEILLFGSQIHLPNYNALFAIEESKLRIHTMIYPDIERIKILLNADKKSFSVDNLANVYLKSDVSPIYTNSPTMKNLVINAVNSGKIKGIIAHVIKGQILYDYEVKSVEKLAENCKIPLNKIETVYNNSGVEQISLRLDAFSEMLNMNTNL